MNTADQTIVWPMTLIYFFIFIFTHNFEAISRINMILSSRYMFMRMTNTIITWPLNLSHFFKVKFIYLLIIYVNNAHRNMILSSNLIFTLPTTLIFLVLEKLLFQGQTNNLFKIHLILVSGVGESMIHIFILVVYW